MTDKVVVLVTAGSLPESRKIAGSLLEKHLAACVNVVPGVRSFYRWEGKIRNDREHLLFIKTTRGHFEELRAEIERLHSYQVPEIVCLPIVEGSANYLNWIDESVKPLTRRGPGRQ